MFKYFALQLWFVVICTGLCILTQNAFAVNGLKSAYLGGAVWEENLSAKEINDQVKGHFEAAIVQLEAKNASSLLTALMRAEASAKKPWSKDERRAALIFLAHNRRQQIERIRDYMNRGLFPLNEGQSPDAVPVFVDRHGTHCAVAHLMRSDGKDTEIAQIATTNNLVRIRDVHGGSMLQWIRSSGLTQEEVAMVQPAYAINRRATIGFQSFLSGPNLRGLGFTLSDFSVRGARFNATLPTNFTTDPTAIDAVFAQGLVELQNNNVVGTAFRDTRGGIVGPRNTPITVVEEFGDDEDSLYSSTTTFGTPSNLDTWLYLGAEQPTGGLVGGANASGNVGIVEIEYLARADEGREFSEVAVTSLGGQNAIFLSEIYHGNSNDLVGRPKVLSAVGSETASLSEDLLRIKSYGLVLGAGRIGSFFNEFETTLSPVLRGDVNLDGSVNFTDIPSFIAVLQSGASLVPATNLWFRIQPC